MSGSACIPVLVPLAVDDMDDHAAVDVVDLDPGELERRIPVP